MRWHLLPLAVSNTTGTARFPTNCIHEECNFDLNEEKFGERRVTCAWLAEEAGYPRVVGQPICGRSSITVVNLD